jgi:DNA replication protein DnaC
MSGRALWNAYEHLALGVASYWPFEEWGRFLPEHNTAVSLLDQLVHHGVVFVTSGESFRIKEARARGSQFLSKKK